MCIIQKSMEILEHVSFTIPISCAEFQVKLCNSQREYKVIEIGSTENFFLDLLVYIFS